VSHLFWYPGYKLPLRHVIRAENCYLYTADGERYVDLESGVWCTAIGHSHPAVLQALERQARQISHTGYSYSNEVVEAAARAVLDLHGFDDGKCNFLCSGSEAVEFSVRVAQMVKSWPLLLTLSDSYFGAYGAARRQAADEWFAFDWQDCAACETEGDCRTQCAHWAAIPFERIGGFLFEPGSSSGLVRFPPHKLIRSIAATVQAGGGLVLINEVTTGMGRTGKWFGYQHYSLEPDSVAMGKGIGNGYPVSVAALSPGLIKRLGDRPLPYAQSHQNDPLGAAVALAVINAIKDNELIAKSQRIADQLKRGLEEIRTRTGCIAAIRGRGLMTAIELTDASPVDFTARVQQQLLRAGYIVAQRPDLNVLRIDPPLTIGEWDIAEFLETFEVILSGQSADGKDCNA